MGLRPFARQALRVLNGLATRVEQATHPLLDPRDEPKAGGKVLLIVITADRGLCGSFNSNVIKSAGSFVLDDPDREVALGLIGRKGRDFFARRGFEVRYEQVNLFAKLSFEDAQDIAQSAMAAFGDGGVDAVYVLYNEFKSVMQQRIVIERLLRERPEAHDAVLAPPELRRRDHLHGLGDLLRRLDRPDPPSNIN